MATVHINLNRKEMMFITYYVCDVCNLYHPGKPRPQTCDRCGSTKLSRVVNNDPDFNFVMQIAMNMKKEK